MNITATLLVQLVAFAVLIFFVNKVLWKPLSELMAKRQERIEDGLAAAEKAQMDKKQAEEQISKTLDESKVQALEIISQAQKQAGQIVNQAKTEAETEAEKVKTRAQAELAQELVQTKSELQQKLSSLVMQGVKKVLDKEVDEKAHKGMVDKLAKSLSS